MGITQIISSLAMIAVLILPGFIFGKLKMCDSHITKGLSNMIINMCVPAVIIDALQTQYTKELALNMGLCALLWAVTLIFAFLLSFLLKRLLSLSKSETALVICVLSVPNTCFIGLPLLNALYGSETLFYSSLCEIINDLFLYTLVFSVVGFATGCRSKFNIKELINPPTVSVVIGLILFFTGTKLPMFLSTPVKYIADATTPIALFIIGFQLSQMKFKELLGDKRIYALCIARLIIMPLIAIIIFKAIPAVSGIFPTVFILMMGMPAGAICSVVAENFNSDVAFATKCVMLSNVLCIITIPIFALIL